jgi:hypothetical protein
LQAIPTGIIERLGALLDNDWMCCWRVELSNLQGLSLVIAL